MNSKFQAKNIRPHDKLVHLDPPQVHFSAYVTGGLKKLFTKIKSNDASVLPLYEYGRFTDINGHFVPEKNSLLASRYRVLGKVSARTHGQSSVQIFAKDEFNWDSLVVIKVLHKTWGHLAYQEIHFLWSLNVADPHKASRVVQLLNIFELDDHFCLVFEPLVPAPLTRVFQGFNRDQLIPNIKKVTLRVLTTLGFLQQQNIIHADLKPENILLKSESDVGSVTVIDFGNAIHNRFKEVALYFKDFELQTLLYRAPEVLFGLPFGTEIDLWSLGCILAELYSGMPLFPGTSKIPVIKEMTRLLGPFPRGVFQKGKFYDDLKGYTDACEQKNASEVLFKKLGCRDYLFRDFLSGLLRYDPADRLTPLQAAQHPFLASELPVAFLMPSEQIQKVTKPSSSKELPVNSTPLEIDQLKPDLLQKVKLIKPLQKDTVKIEENLGDFQRPIKRVKESPGMSRRYHSMSDVKDHKSNSDSKIQRQVKISPFHVSNDRKISSLFSPKQTGTGLEQFDNLMTSTENPRQRNSKSLVKVREDGNSSGQRENSRDRISNDERHLQSLMREIHEVQEMVEDSMDQGSVDSADSFEMKRRRFSDSQFSTVTQDRNNPRSWGLNSETGRTSSKKEDTDFSVQSPRNFRFSSDVTSSSKLNKNSWPFLHEAQPNRVGSRHIKSCDERIKSGDDNHKDPQSYSVFGSKVRPFIQASQSASGSNRKESTPISYTCSNSISPHNIKFTSEHSEQPFRRNLPEHVMCPKTQEKSQNAESFLQSKQGKKNRLIISSPKNETGHIQSQKEKEVQCDKFSDNMLQGDSNLDEGLRLFKRKIRSNDEEDSSPIPGSGLKKRGWSDFYKVKQPVEVCRPRVQDRRDQSTSSGLHSIMNTEENERMGSLASSEGRLQQNSKNAVPRKRLMFTNALNMKKRRKKDVATSGAKRKQSKSADQIEELDRSKDPFRFPNKRTLSNEHSRLLNAGDDGASHSSNDSSWDSHHQGLEEDSRAGTREGQNSLQNNLRKSQADKFNKRQRFSLDFSPVEQRDSQKRYDWTFDQ